VKLYRSIYGLPEEEETPQPELVLNEAIASSK
jgi:starch synthase